MVFISTHRILFIVLRPLRYANVHQILDKRIKRVQIEIVLLFNIAVCLLVYIIQSSRHQLPNQIVFRFSAIRAPICFA